MTRSKKFSELLFSLLIAIVQTTLNVILSVLGSVMTLNVLLFVIQYVNLPDATLVAKNLEMQSVMLNVKNLNVKSNVLIKHVKLKIALSV